MRRGRIEWWESIIDIHERGEYRIDIPERGSIE